MSRILSVDYGDVRIGTALSDPLKMFAKGYKTVINNQSTFDELIMICKEQQVEAIVFGMPYNREGKVGFAAEKVVRFAISFKKYLADKNFDIPFFEIDEAFSTVEADTVLSSRIKQKKKRTAVIDQIAAAAILTQFLAIRKPIPLNLKSVQNE